MDEPRSLGDPEVLHGPSAFYVTKMTRQPGQGLGMGLGFEGDFVIVTSVEDDSPADLANVMEGAPLLGVGGCGGSEVNMGERGREALW
jgi:predicted metalloprotease with PDZ domain